MPSINTIPLRNQTLCGLLLVVAVMLATPAATTADNLLRDQAVFPFGGIGAVEPHVTSTPEVRLGRALDWDARLSVDGKTACARREKTAGIAASDHRMRAANQSSAIRRPCLTLRGRRPGYAG